jgi:RNA polymerase sigma-70 factor, ECF subfamily
MTLVFSVEQDLIRQARQGDPQAFERLVTEFTPSLFRVIRRMTADSDTAESILQETFWRVWQALPRYSEDRRFFPYLVTIATNLLKDAWRKDKHLLPDDLDTLDERAGNLPTPENLVEEAEQMQILRNAVEGLPASYRAVIALRYDAGFSYEEIAGTMNIPVNTVRTLLRRAKLSLRSKLEDTNG